MVWIATGRRKLSELLEEERLFLVSPHIEGIITLGAGEEVDEVAGGARGMDVDRRGEVGDRASEGQAAGVYWAGFTAGSMAGK